MHNLRSLAVGLISLIFAFLLPALVISAQEKDRSTESKNQPNPNEDIIISTDLISFTLSVTDKNGRALSGLEKDSVTIFDNKMKQEVSFLSLHDAPASVSIVFDTSGSMNGKMIVQARQALADFIKTTHQNDEFFLIDFNSHARLLLDRTRDTDSILEKFTFLNPNGNTALYDAIKLGLERAEKGVYSKKIVLVISDGEDNNSRQTFKGLKRQLQESNEIIYAVGFGGTFSPKSHLTGQEVLTELANVSGGRAFFPKNETEIYEAFDQIALDIRQLYSIGYYPSAFTPNGNRHQLEVKVNVPTQTTQPVVHYRKVYYANAK